MWKMWAHWHPVVFLPPEDKGRRGRWWEGGKKTFYIEII